MYFLPLGNYWSTLDPLSMYAVTHTTYVLLSQFFHFYFYRPLLHCPKYGMSKGGKAKKNCKARQIRT
jgi:hypothetical protein